MSTTTNETSSNLRRWGKAALSDLSLHGITYLGVLIVFASLLGLLLFSFADVPTAQQPFYELGMASVFFGFAWYLRRQEAKYAARAMELVGGMVLPLVLFAGLVDDAPFPPDFDEGALIAVMAAVALGVSLIYRLISQSNPESVLGYLVAPLWWLTALVIGFWFKTDEVLTGDAITRLVSEQPAMAAAAVALTLLFLPAEWVRKPAVVAVSSAYLLTLALAAGESWEPTGALLLAGVATVISIEVLARGTRVESRLGAIRPLLAGLVILPLVPRLENYLLGLLILGVYLAIYEISSRAPGSAGLFGARIGIFLGAALTLNHNWSSIAAFSVLTIWGLVRMRTAEEKQLGEFEAVAALAPIGIANGLALLVDPSDAFALMAGVVAIVAIPMSRLTSQMLRAWPSAASVIIAAGLVGTSPPILPLRGVGALVVTAGVVFLTKRNSLGRFWFAAAALSTAMFSLFERFGDTDAVASLTLASVGLVIVVISSWRHDRVALNVSYFGLGLTFIAGVIGGPGWTALALGLVAVRTGVSARFTEGSVRNLNQAAAAISSGAGWIYLLTFIEPGPTLAIEATAAVWGALALVIGLSARIKRLNADWVWTGLGASSFLIAVAWLGAVSSLHPRPGLVVAVMVGVLGAAVELSWPRTDPLLRIATPALIAISIVTAVMAADISVALAVQIVAIVAGASVVVTAELERRRSSHLAILIPRLAVAFIVLFGAWMVSLLETGFEVAVAVSGGIFLAGLGLGRLAHRFDSRRLRLGATVLWVAAVYHLGWAADWSGRDLAVASAVMAAMAVLAFLVVWHRDHDTSWDIPLIGIAVVADFVAVAIAMTLFPDTEVTMVVSLSIATQTLAGGLVMSSPGLLSVAPPAAAAGFLAALGDTLTEHVTWWTVPLGLVGLAEIEILRAVRRQRGEQSDTPGSLVVEALSAAVIVLPVLASLFTDGLIFAALGIAAAVVGMLWGIVTRMRRRVYGAAGVGLATAILTLVAAAANTAPESVAFWVTGAGIGITILMGAGYVEAYRKRRGQMLERVDRLMERWG